MHKSPKRRKRISARSSATGLAISEPEPKQEAESSRGFSGGNVAGIKCITKWVWDRRKQTWVEIIEKSFPEESIVADDYIDEESLVKPSPLNTPHLVLDKIKRTMPLCNLVTTKALLMRIIRVINTSSRAFDLHMREDATRDLLDKERETTSTYKGVETRQLNKTGLRGAETGTAEILTQIEERVKARVDGMIIQLQERAEEQAEKVVSRAKERVTLQVESLLIKTEESADALLKNISSRAEERASAPLKKENINLSKESQRSIVTPYPRELKTIGDHIRKRRLDLTMLQQEVAQMMSVTTQTIRNWENNRTSPPFRYTPKLIEFLGYWPYDTPAKTLGARITSNRKLRGINQRHLAVYLGVNQSTVESWEKDKHRPLKRYWEMLSSYLNINVSQDI